MKTKKEIKKLIRRLNGTLSKDKKKGFDLAFFINFIKREAFKEVLED